MFFSHELPLIVHSFFYNYESFESILLPLASYLLPLNNLLDDFQRLPGGGAVCLHVFLSEPLGDGTTFLAVHGLDFMDNLFLVVTTALHLQCFADIEVHAPHSLIMVVVVGVAEHGFPSDGVVEKNAGVVGNEQV